MDTYIVQIYRREVGSGALVGRIEHVSKRKVFRFDSAEGLWELLLRVSCNKKVVKRASAVGPSRARRDI